MSVCLFIESAYKYFPTKMAFLPSHVSAIPVMLMCFWPCQLLPSEECPNGTRLPLAWLWRPFLDASDPRQGRSSALTFTPRFTVPGIPASQRPVPQPRTQEVAPLALPAPRLPARAPPPASSCLQRLPSVWPPWPPAGLLHGVFWPWHLSSRHGDTLDLAPSLMLPSPAHCLLRSKTGHFKCNFFKLW